MNYFNGVSYVWPTANDGPSKILTNNGAGALSWTTAPSAEGLWSGSYVLSTVACPAGWTRVLAADDKALRGAATEGGTGGGGSHAHDGPGGVVAASGADVSGSAAASTFTVSGSTGTSSVSHAHANTTTNVGVEAAPPGSGTRWLSSVTVQNADPGHSHGAAGFEMYGLAGDSHTHDDGTLAAGQHGHAPGTLSLSSATTLAAYYNLLVCRKD